MPFQQDHVGPAHVRQVIGHAAADHTATDNYHAGPLGKGATHLRVSSLPLCAARLSH